MLLICVRFLAIRAPASNPMFKVFWFMINDKSSRQVLSGNLNDKLAIGIILFSVLVIHPYPDVEYRV